MSFDTSGVVFADDMDVALDANDYVDAAPPAPIDEGRYGFTITSMSLRKDREGNVIKRDGKYPIITLEMVEVVVPAESKRPVALYQDVSTKPFTRYDFEREANVTVNNLADLIRSADITVSFRGIEEGLDVLKSLVAQKAVFHARFQWEATDVAAAKEDVEEFKNSENYTEGSDESRKAINKIWASHRTRGQKKFNGKPYVVGRDGENIDARVVIPMEGFISQANLEKVTLGPTGKRKAA